MSARTNSDFGSLRNEREPLEFSLVAGGPLYRTLENLHLVRNGAELLRRRILAVILITWVPPVVLELMRRNGTSAMLLAREADVHVRFLIVLPLLFATEHTVHAQLQPILSQFISRGIITAKQYGRFRRFIDALHQMRDSWIPETFILIFAYTAGVFVRHYFEADSVNMTDSAARLWYKVISVPLFQFILFRWYFRYLLWIWFLRKIATLDLQLIPTHPDGSAGLSFLARSVLAFIGVAVAHMVLLSAWIAAEILNKDGSLQDYRVIIATTYIVVLGLAFASLGTFAMPLLKARREGTRQYGILASSYVEEFHYKWIHKADRRNDLMGSPDIQSLADLANSYSIVKNMCLIPCSRRTLVAFAVLAAVPLAPLLLLEFPLKEIAHSLIRFALRSF